jgi:class 3 adenylate cyclase
MTPAADDELPSGTVTFLFSDLEGSTRLWEEHPDAMRSALLRHDALLRGAVEATGGQVVKTTGDGVHAVFATARDALYATVAAQHAPAIERVQGPLRWRSGQGRPAPERALCERDRLT